MKLLGFIVKVFQIFLYKCLNKMGKRNWSYSHDFDIFLGKGYEQFFSRAGGNALVIQLAGKGEMVSVWRLLFSGICGGVEHRVIVCVRSRLRHMATR